MSNYFHYKIKKRYPIKDTSNIVNYGKKSIPIGTLFTVTFI